MLCALLVGDGTWAAEQSRLQIDDDVKGSDLSATTGATTQPAPDGANKIGTTVDEEFARARNLFAYGDFRAAASALSDLTMPGRLSRNEDLVDAHRMLGICYFQLEQPTEARREFMALLYLSPDTRLDPFLTPPAIVEFFDAVRREIDDKLVAVREKKLRDGKETKPKIQIPLVERTFRRHSGLAPFVPLGFPQFDRGAYLWGTIFLSGQVMGAVGATASYFAALAFLQADGHIERDNLAIYKTLRIVNWSAAGFAATFYAAQLLEAYFSHRPTTLENQTVRTIEADQIPLPATAPTSE
jgi:hypothetical protein